MFRSKSQKFLVLTLFGLLGIVQVSARAMAAGPRIGGGGDIQTEARIDEIRADLLKWISEGGAEGLQFSEDLTLKQYRETMSALLQPHAVVIGAITDAEEARTNDPELKVAVAGQPKACRSFISMKDGLPHILCKVERFNATAPSMQYQLIHHEYASLAGLEKNLGASSDYRLSRQISEFLVLQTVLKLAVRQRDSSSEAGTLFTKEGKYGRSVTTAESASFDTLPSGLAIEIHCFTHAVEKYLRASSGDGMVLKSFLRKRSLLGEATLMQEKRNCSFAICGTHYDSYGVPINAIEFKVINTKTSREYLFRSEGHSSPGAPRQDAATGKFVRSYECLIQHVTAYTLDGVEVDLSSLGR